MNNWPFFWSRRPTRADLPTASIGAPCAMVIGRGPGRLIQQRSCRSGQQHAGKRAILEPERKQWDLFSRPDYAYGVYHKRRSRPPPWDHENCHE